MLRPSELLGQFAEYLLSKSIATGAAPPLPPEDETETDLPLDERVRRFFIHYFSMCRSGSDLTDVARALSRLLVPGDPSPSGVPRYI